MLIRTLHIGDDREMIMAAHWDISGKLTEWEDYVERLENYFVAQDTRMEAKKRAVLLSECGMATTS